MTFKEAHEKLQLIADGRYNAIKYQITSPQKGEKYQECQVYIDGGEWYFGPTWENAFAQLEAEVQNGTIESIPNIPEL